MHNYNYANHQISKFWTLSTLFLQSDEILRFELPTFLEVLLWRKKQFRVRVALRTSRAPETVFINVRVCF